MRWAYCLHKTGGEQTKPCVIEQVLPVPDMAVAAPSAGADGSVFVAARGDAGIRRLGPVPFATQARRFALQADTPGALLPSNPSN